VSVRYANWPFSQTARDKDPSTRQPALDRFDSMLAESADLNRLFRAGFFRRSAIEALVVGARQAG